MKQFYSNLCDVPELEDQRRVTIYMESTESRTPTRAFELNSLYLLHAVLYRNYTDIVSSADNPLHSVLLELGHMPDQVSHEQNKQVLLRLHLRPRDDLLSATGHGGGSSSALDVQAELRQKLLDCLAAAPTVQLRQNEGLDASMRELLRECRDTDKYEAAASVQRVLDLLGRTDSISGSAGEQFLQATADEISN